MTPQDDTPLNPPQSITSASDFQNSTHVSRETLEKLEAYAALLIKWQSRINLVGPKTLNDLWQRHFFDSAQLFPHLPDRDGPIVDLGSGAGFPGLVLAILSNQETHLIESDTRKAAFLREAARAAGVSNTVTVHAKRAEDLTGLQASVITARALAPLETLLPWVEKFWTQDTIGLFPKGVRYKTELTDVNYGWYINYSVVGSQVDPGSVILKVTELRRSNPDAEIPIPD